MLYADIDITIIPFWMQVITFSDFVILYLERNYLDKFCDCVVGKMRGTYENIIRIISLIFVVTAIGGCGKSQQYQESTDFPKGMKTELTEQIKVNAEFQYPENCKNGKCAETQISGQTLWDKQEEIAQLLVQDGNITNEYIDDYGTVQYKIL